MTSIALPHERQGLANIAATVFDETGRPVGLRQLQISASGHISSVVTAILAETAGGRGLVQLESVAV